MKVDIKLNDFVRQVESWNIDHGLGMREAQRIAEGILWDSGNSSIITLATGGQTTDVGLHAPEMKLLILTPLEPGTGWSV